MIFVATIESTLFGALIMFILMEKFIVMPLKTKLRKAQMARLEGLTSQLGNLGKMLGGIEFDMATAKVRHISPDEASAMLNTEPVVSPIQLKKKKENE